MPSRKWIFAISLIVFIGSGYGLLTRLMPQKTRPLDQQVYIWQRLWTAQHEDALKQSRNLFSTLRILGLQVHPQEGIRYTAVNKTLIKQDGRPVWLVARLDGQLSHINQQNVVQNIVRTMNEWKEAGIKLAGIEIDFDAPTAKLVEYQQLLRTLRQNLPAELKLSITALPDWLNSPHLPALLADADISVLQVHTVLPPQQGLFDSKLAKRWSTQYARISPHPFYIALPAYGSALTRDNRIESEAPLYIAQELLELSVAPQTLADFTQQLEQKPPSGLLGLIWFRLPLANDRRSWSLSTLDAVIHHKPLTPRWSLIISPQADKQLIDLAIKNNGDIDAPLPQQIELPAAQCTYADGAGHYQAQTNASSLRFIRISTRQLRAGESSALGWARCTPNLQGEFNVIP